MCRVPWCMLGEGTAPAEPTPFALPEIVAIVGTRVVNYLFLEEPDGLAPTMVRAVFGGGLFRANSCDVLDCTLSRWLR